MPGPDFSKQTVETLAKRARFQCSNPDCRTLTVGPNTDPQKATTIGEAAHIFGAKPGSKRYNPNMSDVTRSEITNGIWLCRNCHGLVDRDASQFSAELLFTWRKEHEAHVMLELGTPGERLRYQVEEANLDPITQYPLIIQRIATDKSDGWEWRLTAELLRHLNKSEFKRLTNLKAGHYFKQFPSVGEEEFLSWVAERAHIMSHLVNPISGLFERLTESWGEPGVPGNIEEIHDTCILFRDLLTNMVDHEEVLRFTRIPREGGEIRDILADAIGRNLVSLEKFPEQLDKVVSLIGTDHGGTVENPKVLNYVFEFNLPENFNARIDAALARYSENLDDY
ncbi:hypothetical protein [Ruegeria atlantica]|uniref:hypothetical protein n=1 Tax=Ruegeria atlantica TaxID=81569 RepID=UPI00147FBFD9|nr:hypothetical protein [Ruegeria atlantica]